MPIQMKTDLSVKPKEPKLYLVSIIYDQYVSWEFCMKVLRDVFKRNQQDSEAITNEILTNGEGFCGGYIYEIAETKAEIVEELAKKEGFSLICLIEEV